MNAPACADASPPQPAGVAWRRRAADLPGWFATLVVVVAVAAVAAATRLPRLDSAPPGFLIDEAASALYARSINRDNLPLFFGGGTIDVQEPFFFYVMKWTGTLAGWDIVGARLAAALCGIAAAAGCALWYARALGRLWGLAGGLLVATSFWQLMFSRQAIRPISMAIFAAGGLWLLWVALTLPADSARRTRLLAWAASGAAFGAGFYTYISFRLIVVVMPLIAALLLHHRRARAAASRKRPDPGTTHPIHVWGSQADVTPSSRGCVIALLVMFAVMSPLAVYYARHPGDFTRRAEQVRAEEGGAEVLDDPLSIITGYLATARSVVWDGYASANVNQPGRPLLDPLLAVWAVAGLLVALRRPLQPLHGVGLFWFAVFILPSALSSPGHPVRMLAATPAVFLFPLLSMRAAVARARRAGGRAGALAAVAVALTIGGSAIWSLHDYFRVWAPSHAAYVAFQGDVRDSLEAIDALPAGDAPVYYSSWTLDRLVRYLAPTRPHHVIDGRTSLHIPNEGVGYLVYPTVTAPDASLLSLIAEAPTIAGGRMPDGSIAWQARLLDARVRDRLPYVVPPVGFADGYTLVGFDIAPAPDTGGNPRVAVTIVWRLPAGAPAHVARVRLVPVGAPPEASPPVQADVSIHPAPAALLGARAREIVITRLLIAFPASPGLLADVQVALLAPDGTPLPLTSAPAGATDGFAQLNRVLYQFAGP